MLNRLPIIVFIFSSNVGKDFLNGGISYLSSIVVTISTRKDERKSSHAYVCCIQCYASLKLLARSVSIKYYLYFFSFFLSTRWNSQILDSIVILQVALGLVYFKMRGSLIKLRKRNLPRISVLLQQLCDQQSFSFSFRLIG